MWEVRYAKRIKKDLKAIPLQYKQQIKLAIEKLTNDPFGYGKQLKNHPLADYCLRVGIYRVLFDLDEQKKRIEILKIGHRRDIYR